MRNNKGFTLIELMIVVAIIAIIAAIAIPNLLQSRLRANEATAVTCVKGYATGQVTFLAGKQGRLPANTGADANGNQFIYADNYRNLFYGNPIGAFAGGNYTAMAQSLSLISQAMADAYCSVGGADQGGATTNNTPVAPTRNEPYQGYFFTRPSEVAAPANFYSGKFALIAVPVNSGSTGNMAFFIDDEGTVKTQGLAKGDLAADAAAHATPLTAASAKDWDSY